MSNAVAKKELSQGERFMNAVVAQFSGGVDSTVALTQFQRRLAQNYFISLDAALKAAEEKRLKKSEKYREDLEYSWHNVNMEKLARDVVTYARVGFDPAQKNHINMIPFRNGKSNKYDIGFIEGYRGIELKSVKYGLNVPDHVVVELVHASDKFRPIKRDARNKYEGYELEIVSPFDRGDVVGGFYYHSYSQAPEKNKLVMFSIKDILKRKPDKASPEFWGGEKDKWENGKKVGSEKVDGWYEQMCLKTIYRAAYSDITIDSQKIDDDYMRLNQLEQEYAERAVEQEIAENGNRSRIDITPEAEPASSPDVPSPIEPSEDPGPHVNLDELDLDF